MYKGLTNQVSGRPGQPEKGSGQPDSGGWLPSGQLRFSIVFFSEIFLIYLRSLGLCFKYIFCTN